MLAFVLPQRFISQNAIVCERGELVTAEPMSRCTAYRYKCGLRVLATAVHCPFVGALSITR